MIMLLTFLLGNNGRISIGLADKTYYRICSILHPNELKMFICMQRAFYLFIYFQEKKINNANTAMFPGISHAALLKVSFVCLFCFRQDPK